jgi:hypothetical protein
MYDLVAVGLDGMGSAAYQLAGRGKQVLGLEKHIPACDKGSNYGRSRTSAKRTLRTRPTRRSSCVNRILEVVRKFREGAGFVLGEYDT